MGEAPMNEPHPPSQGVSQSGDGSATFTVWAPDAERVELVTPDARRPMRRGDGNPYGREHWTATLADVSRGFRYGYAVDGGPTRPDPATRWQPDGVHEMSAVDFPGDHDWRHPFAGVPRRDLVIYELHVGTFTPAGTFDAAIARLPDLVELGITAIEVMPVSQFPGTRGWGYDGVHPFAVQHSYGHDGDGPAAFRRFIDAAHGLGLGVILDVVYNHFGPEGNYLAAFGPYTTGRYRTPWGEGLNFDGRGSDMVRRFVCDNVRHWIGDYRLDGLRLDAIQTMIDVSARHVLSDIAQTAREAAGDRIVHVIGETDQNDVRLVRPTKQNGIGLDAIWADDLHHAIHALVTGESDTYYADFHPPHATPAGAIADCLAGGLSRDGRYSAFRGHKAGRPYPDDAARSRLVTCIQNHDQVGNRAFGDRLHTTCSPAQYRLAVALNLLAPLTPLVWMGEEYAEPRPFPFFCDFGDPAINEAVRRGRAEAYWPDDPVWTDAMPDPPRRRTFESAVLTWDWSAPDQSSLRTLYRDLLAIRRERLREEIPPRVDRDGDVLHVRYERFALLANLGGQAQPIEATDVLRSTLRDVGQVGELQPWEAVVVM